MINKYNLYNRDEILRNLSLILKRHLEGLNTSIYLYGSWAKGTEKKSSDIDIAIDYDTPLPSGKLSELRTVIEESNVPYRVEIVDLTKTDSSFRDIVLKEGLKWND